MYKRSSNVKRLGKRCVIFIVSTINFILISLNLNNYFSMKHAIVADEGIRTSVDTF